MKDKETKLIERLIDDKEFLSGFSKNRSIEEQLGFLRANGFNFSEDEFKDFLKSIGEAYVSNESMSDEDLENVSGGKMQMRNKVAVAALLFSAIGAPMLGQSIEVAASWWDLMPHNIVRSAYNWMFPSKNETTKNIEETETTEKDELTKQKEKWNELKKKGNDLAKKFKLKENKIEEREKFEKLKDYLEQFNRAINNEKPIFSNSKYTPDVVLNALELELNKIEKDLDSFAMTRKGITNLGNSCFLNTTLQVLANESAKDENGRNIKTAILNDFKGVSDDVKEKCPTLNGLYIFFEALQTPEEAVSRDKMEEVIALLNKKGEIYSGVQADSTEALMSILDRCLEESEKELGVDHSLSKTLKELYVFRYLEPEELDVTSYPGDSPEIIEQRKIDKIKREKLKILPDGRYVKPAAERTIYPSIPLSEDKFEEKLAFNEIFDINLISPENLPKNIIIQLPRKHYEMTGGEFQQIKLKNPIKILPEITVHSKNYRLKSISIHSGGTVGGHYYAYSRDGDGKWWCFNDLHVEDKLVMDKSCYEFTNTTLSTEVLTNSQFVRSNATNLTYELVE